MAFDPSKIQIPDSVKQRGLRAGTQTQVDQITRLINAIPTKYTELRNTKKASAKLGLTGLGNYQTGDNPNTPEVETDAIYRADNRIGERETAAVKEADNAANARGMMFSSFRDKSVGNALGRLSREANQVITQYADAMGKLNDDQQTEENGLYGQLETLYGQEVDYLKENPPPPPVTPDPPAGGGGDAGGGSGGGAAAANGPRNVWRGAAKPNLNLLKSKYPNMNLRVVFVNPKNGGAHYTVVATPK